MLIYEEEKKIKRKFIINFLIFENFKFKQKQKN
jgi:hypothetical protein